VAPFEAHTALLAGYMLIFGPRACKELQLLNLHPAEPGGPIGIWQDIVWELIERRAERSGITIFEAVPEVDAGPPVTFCTYSLRGGPIDRMWEAVDGRPAAELRTDPGEELPLFKEIRRRGAEREQPLIVETLRALAEGGAVERPLDLSELVERRLSG
jgi:phosphoribosylglycinamide formyltransferase-1